jgi:hypothetical protein
MNLSNETIADVEECVAVMGAQPRALYFAMESRYAQMFLCEPLGRGLYSEVQLRDWAKRVGVELVLLKKER